MKILILAVHFEVTGARYIADAFARLGHDVKHSGVNGRLEDAWGVDVPEKYDWLSDNVYGFKPDLVIIADTLMSLINYPPHLKQFIEGVPVIKWVQDNHVRNVREEGIAHYFLAHYHGQAQPVSHDDETWLPCAADTTVFTPSAIPWAEREYDICMIGVMYPQRVQLINRLRDEGFKVFAATGLVYEEYQQAYANSRASLCISACGDLAQRFFETAAIGCLVVTDLLRDLEDPDTCSQLGLQGFVSSGFAVDNPYNEDAIVNQCKRWLRGEYDPDDIGYAQAAAKQLQAIVRESHTWERRAQVVVDWVNKEYGVANVTISADKVTNIADTVLNGDDPLLIMAALGKGEFVIPASALTDMPDIYLKPKPFLNLGCGKTHLPSAKPAGHEAVADAIYEYPLWVNVDKVEGVGADKTFDLFAYPWPLEDNSFDGALLAHIVEHIPHEIKQSLATLWLNYGENGTQENEKQYFDRWKELKDLQDGWYAFWSELYRVLTPGATVHLVSPYGWSDGGITDPSHTRLLTLNTFTHSMTPEISDGSTFKYNNGGINFVIDGSPLYRITPTYAHIRDQEEMQQLMMTRLNVVYDFMIRLKCVK